MSPGPPPGLRPPAAAQRRAGGGEGLQEEPGRRAGPGTGSRVREDEVVSEEEARRRAKVRDFQKLFQEAKSSDDRLELLDKIVQQRLDAPELVPHVARSLTDPDSDQRIYALKARVIISPKDALPDVKRAPDRHGSEGAPGRRRGDRGTAGPVPVRRALRAPRERARIVRAAGHHAGPREAGDRGGRPARAGGRQRPRSQGGRAGPRPRPQVAFRRATARRRDRVLPRSQRRRPPDAGRRSSSASSASARRP